MVELRGLIKSGTTTNGTTIFTLPVGLRPSATHLVPARANSGDVGYFDIQTDGRVRITNIASTSWLTIESISFSVS